MWRCVCDWLEWVELGRVSQRVSLWTLNWIGQSKSNRIEVNWELQGQEWTGWRRETNNCNNKLEVCAREDASCDGLMDQAESDRLDSKEHSKIVSKNWWDINLRARGRRWSQLKHGGLQYVLWYHLYAYYRTISSVVHFFKVPADFVRSVGPISIASVVLLLLLERYFVVVVLHRTLLFVWLIHPSWRCSSNSMRLLMDLKLRRSRMHEYPEQNRHSYE